MKVNLKSGSGGMSMRRNQGGKNRIPHIIAFVVAIALGIGVAAVLPIPVEYKKLLGYVLVIGFAIAGVLISNIARRK